jgi:hypothetical protein
VFLIFLLANIQLFFFLVYFSRTDQKIKIKADYFCRHFQNDGIDICFSPKSLNGLEEQWKKWIDEHLSHEQTLTNCLIAASFITYLGPFDVNNRKRLYNQFFSICQKNAIPKEPQQIFKVS